MTDEEILHVLSNVKFEKACRPIRLEIFANGKWVRSTVSSFRVLLQQIYEGFEYRIVPESKSKTYRPYTLEELRERFIDKPDALYSDYKKYHIGKIGAVCCNDDVAKMMLPGRVREPHHLLILGRWTSRDVLFRRYQEYNPATGEFDIVCGVEVEENTFPS